MRIVLPWLCVHDAKLFGSLKAVSSVTVKPASVGSSRLVPPATTTSPSKNTAARPSVVRPVAGVVKAVGKEIRLVLDRYIPSMTCTLGEMRCEQEPWLRFYTLEPATPIPVGTYSVSLYQSPHFGRLVPLLHDVPGHTEIEIHSGNYPRDTKGCILIGLKLSTNALEQSRLAFKVLMDVLASATSITIQISA